MKMISMVCFATLLGATVAAPKLDERYHDSTKCKPCHMARVQEWSRSYHAKSHYKHDEYLRKTMDYYARKTHKPLNAVKVKCATCHNPRIAVTSTDIDYDIAAILHLDKESEVNKAVDDSALSEGVNCLVCHNVDAINHKLPPEKRGAHRIKWNPVGVMSGPFKDAKSPYHKTQYRDFFGKDPKQLCLVCHGSDYSIHDIAFANTEKEYENTKKQCADCHMSPKKEGVASNFPIDNGKPKKRLIREHAFVGGHVAWMWEDALSMHAKRKGKALLLTIRNDNPHNIPTGFGSRELVLDITYRSGTQVLKKKSLSLTSHYLDKRGKPTIPHLAKKVTEHFSVPAKGMKTIKVPVVKGAGMVTFELYYRLVNDEVRKLLKLEEAQWAEKKYITRTTLRL